MQRVDAEQYIYPVPRACREMITVSLSQLKHGSTHMHRLNRKLFLQVNRSEFHNLSTKPIAF